MLKAGFYDVMERAHTHTLTHSLSHTPTLHQYSQLCWVQHAHTAASSPFYCKIGVFPVRGDQKERTAAAPTERPGSKRTSEMRILYGKGAAMIHGMETALQMNFDRNLDVLQPSLWPNMPFRVIFD